jgi:hypothetical protein
MSDDDIVQLKRMRDQGEISDAQYEVLRRHVLWGTPLPEAMESLAGEQPRQPRGRHSRQDQPRPRSAQPHRRPAQPPPGPAQQHPSPAGPPSGSGVDYFRPAAPPPDSPTYPGPPVGETGPRQAAPHPAPSAPGRAPTPGPTEAQRRSRRRRGQAAFLVSMLLVVALVGAGVWWFELRPVGVAPAEYARAVCSQVQGWHDDVTARSGELQQALNRTSDREAARAALASFFDQAAGRTGQLRRDIDGIGAPAISAGPAYVASMDRRLDDTAASFRDSAQKSRAANVSDQATFTITLQVLQSQVDQLIGGVTGSLADSSTPTELRTAYNNASGCAPFTG